MLVTTCGLVLYSYIKTKEQLDKADGIRSEEEGVMMITKSSSSSVEEEDSGLSLNGRHTEHRNGKSSNGYNSLGTSEELARS